MGVPVIDFSKLVGGERAETMAQIARGCEEWGFFQLVNHGIPVELLEKVKEACSKWYRAEREDKFGESVPAQLLNKTTTDASAGGDDHMKDVDWEDVITLQGDPADWPLLPPHFQEAMVEYRAELKKLAERVAEVMDENMGLDRGYINRAFRGGREPFFGTKVSHYPPCPRPGAATGLRAHTDAGGVILLFQDDRVGGLQVLRGGEWVDVQPLENAVVINTGDQIEVLSNGKYKSALHRVVVGAEGTRRSIASFYNPSYQATIAPAKALVEKAAAVGEEVGEKESGDGGRGSYPEFLFGDYMAVYGKQKFMAKEPRFQAVRAM